MSGPQIPALAKPFLASLAEAIRLFSFSSPQSENRAYLSPSNSPPAPVIDKNLPHERYSDAVKQLRPLFPPACPWLQPGDVKMVGNVPVNAEGFADIWEGTLDDRSVLQKSYRCYESCDIERIFRVRNKRLHAPHDSHSVPGIFQRVVGVHSALPSKRRPSCRD